MLIFVQTRPTRSTPLKAHTKTSPAQPPQVRAAWLLTALGLLLLAAACCSYLSLCLLFVQGSWQLLYHPSRTLSNTPASEGLPFTEIHFGVTDSGVAELTGWWLPAESSRAETILYLHGATGSLGDTVPALADLHKTGCAVFAIDYRGYGQSVAAHPSESGMVKDARTAITYLEQTRHLRSSSLVLWGRGAGATIAAEAAAGTSMPLVLEDVNAPALAQLRGDPRLRLLPIRWLLRDRLDASDSVAASRSPKLFLGDGESSGSADPDPTRRLFGAAQGPKRLADPGGAAALRAFLSSAAQTADGNQADSFMSRMKESR